MILQRQWTTSLFSLILLFLAVFAHAEGEYVTYLHSDMQGSPVVATNEQGQVIWRESYAPWGQREIKDAASANPGLGSKTWYTGKEEEEALGLYYYGARWYSPDIGQFTSIDPVGPILSNPRSFNRYVYANNNPIRYKDPDGRLPVDTVLDGLNVLYDLGKMGVGYATGNPGLVTEGAADLAVDAGAMAVPYIPAGSSKLARMAGEGAERTYHRLGDSPEAIEQIKKTGELVGNPARNYMPSPFPKVKAYEGPLPEGKKGFEFRTDAAPDPGHVPGQPTWTPTRPGVRERDGQAVIGCTITRVGC